MSEVTQMAERTFGDRLAHLREGKNWLQRDLAFCMNVKANTISNWEKGISRPNLDQICRLCQALSVTSDALLGLDKIAIERTLNPMEQRIIDAFRSLDKEMQSHLFHLLSLFGRLRFELAEKTNTLECAEQFIKDSRLEDEWKEAKKGPVPGDENH